MTNAMKLKFFIIIKVKIPYFSKFSVHLVHFDFIAFHKQDAICLTWKFYGSVCKCSNWSLSIFSLEMLLGLSQYPYQTKEQWKIFR